MKKIIIGQINGKICAAIMLEDELLELHWNESSLIGNIYKGRVENILHGMRALFINIGLDKNVFLQSNSMKNISSGKSIMIQIEKEPVELKGARATQNISLAGRFVVFFPTRNGIGISNKIRGIERKRLRELAKKFCPKNSGLIIRTAAEGCNENSLLEDIENMKKLWHKILEDSKKRKIPSLLYSDNNFFEKILRDNFTEDTEIFVDSQKIFNQLSYYIPSEKICCIEDENIFERFYLLKEILTIYERELPLPSGGQIVIDKTEALTVIDVNTSTFIGKTNFNETIFRTNLEAAEIILKQLRLRDIGGIIIVDFIDMKKSSHKKLLMNYLRKQVRLDSHRTKIVDMTPLGLVEITRQSSHR